MLELTEEIKWWSPAEFGEVCPFLYNQGAANGGPCSWHVRWHGAFFVPESPGWGLLTPPLMSRLFGCDMRGLVTSCNPRLRATEVAVKYLWKDVVWALILFPQTRWKSWTFYDLPTWSRGLAKIPGGVLDSKTKKNKLKGKRSQQVRVSLNLMNVDAPPRELIFVYN